MWCGVSKMASGFALQMRADRLALVEREQEAQVGEVRLEQRQSPQVVGAVARHDAQPGVQQVVGLLEQGCRRGPPSPSSPRRSGAAARARLSPWSTSVSEHCPKKWPFTSSLGQRVAELAHGGARRVVDEHLLGPRLGDT